MKQIAVYEAKTRLSELLAEVEQGRQITITRRGQAVARLVPATPARRAAGGSKRQRIADTLAQLKASRFRLEGPLEDLIGEGRD